MDARGCLQLTWFFLFLQSCVPLCTFLDAGNIAGGPVWFRPWTRECSWEELPVSFLHLCPPLRTPPRQCCADADTMQRIGVIYRSAESLFGAGAGEQGRLGVKAILAECETIRLKRTLCFLPSVSVHKPKAVPTVCAGLRFMYHQ